MGNLIVKDNALIEASHKLGEVEQRLILLAILKARNVGDTVQQLKDKTLTIHADDYIQAFGVDRDASYLALKKAVIGLYRAEWGYKYINDKGNTAVRYERFTQSAEYVDGEGAVRFMFSTAIIPMLVELERNFTSYEIEQVANLSSRYAMRLYEMIMRHFDKGKGKGILRISLDELRFRLGLLPNEYARMSDFKKDVFNLAINQINENTDLSVSYQQKKQGRIIVGFEITSKIKPNAKKSKPKNDDSRDPNTPDLLDGYTDQEKAIIAQKQEYARQKGITDPAHKENLINQAIKQHRQAVQAEKERKEREKDERQAQALRDKELLELAQRQFEQILASDELIKTYMISNNLTENTLQGIQKLHYKNGNFKELFKVEKYKFEQLHYLRHLNLKFLD